MKIVWPCLAGAAIILLGLQHHIKTTSASDAETITWGATDPTWSPDGGSLAFGHQDLFAPPRQTFIEVFDVKTRHLSQLKGSQEIFAPRWSPDGRHIVAITYEWEHIDALRC